MNTPERVAIVGSRDFPDLYAVASAVRGFPAGTVIISGGARGVDAMAAKSARTYGFACHEFLPDYAQDGTRAPLMRNQRIAEECDRMIAFWDGKSRGTAHVIQCAKRLGKPVEIIKP